jgi:hypothetical protein
MNMHRAAFSGDPRNSLQLTISPSRAILKDGTVLPMDALPVDGYAELSRELGCDPPRPVGGPLEDQLLDLLHDVRI